MAKIDIAKEIKKLSKEERKNKVIETVGASSTVIDLTTEVVWKMVEMMNAGASNMEIKKAVRLVDGIISDKGYGYTLEQISEVRVELLKIQAEDKEPKAEV